MKRTLEELSELDDRNLFNECLTDKNINKLCKNDDFWEDRAIKYFGSSVRLYKPDDQNWRNFYLKLVSDLDVPDPWHFLSFIDSWDIEDYPEPENIIIFDYERKIFKWDQTLINRFRFLNLGNNIKLYLKGNYFGDLTYKKVVKSKKYVSPEDIFLAIYNFYQEPISIEDFEHLLRRGNPFAGNIDIEDVINKKVKYIDMFGTLRFLKLEKKGDNKYNVIIEDDFYTKQTEMLIKSLNIPLQFK